MKRVKTNYHTLQVLKTADPKLRKAIISNCNKELVNCISECVMNVLNGNIKLPGCVTRKLQKHKSPTGVCPSPRKRNLLYCVGDSCCPY